MSIEYCTVCKKCTNMRETSINLNVMGPYRITKQCMTCNSTISCTDVDPTKNIRRFK